MAPYRNSDDVRFSWLENTFVQYLEDWKAAVDSREGVYTADEKGQSFHPETIQWSQDVCEVTYPSDQVSLVRRFEFVLTERFCEDDVEEYFEYQ